MVGPEAHRRAVTVGTRRRGDEVQQIATQGRERFRQGFRIVVYPEGPRIRAGGLEISVTGAMGDESREHNPRVGPSTIVDGVDEMRRAVRLHCREGVDNIKLDVSGDPFYPNTPGDTTPMSYEEVEMAVKTAHAFGRMVNAWPSPGKVVHFES